MDHAVHRTLPPMNRPTRTKVIWAVLLSLLAACTPSGTARGEAVSGPPLPKVSLRADAAMTAPLEASFSAILPGGGRADWQFADGGSASGANVVHTFYQPGRYPVQARMQVGGHEYLATVPLDVRSAGPEQAAVLLQDAGSVALSAQDSVIYAPIRPCSRSIARPPRPCGSHWRPERIPWG